MENETTISGNAKTIKIQQLESTLDSAQSRNKYLEKVIDENKKFQAAKLQTMVDLFGPVIHEFSLVEEYEVRDIAEEAAREAVDDFDLDNHMDAIRRDVLDNIDLNDYAETIRDICGLNDPVDEREAPNHLDDIRDIIREELSGAYIQGQIKLSDE